MSRIRGEAELKAKLAALMPRMEAAAPAAEHASAEVVARNMQARAPIRTGRLRASIHAEGSSAIADTPYAIPVDRGHGPVPAQPYAEEGAEASYREIESAMIAVFRTALGGR